MSPLSPRGARIFNAAEAQAYDQDTPELRDKVFDDLKEYLLEMEKEICPNGEKITHLWYKDIQMLMKVSKERDAAIDLLKEIEPYCDRVYPSLQDKILNFINNSNL